MAVLHLFNPGNDLALAAGTPRYTPPPVATRLEAAGALIPLWFAAPGDLILAPDSLSPQLERMKARYGLEGELYTPGKAHLVTALSPWGWSADTRIRFRSAGVREELLPSDSQLIAHRTLSHRRTSIAILRELGWPQLPVEAASVDEALRAVDSFDGRAFVKHPWSCSGRGVFDTANLSPVKLREIVSGGIRRQGSVMIEPAYSKVADFAMLFFCRGGRAEFHGLSLFDTHPGGAYSGNLIAPQQQIAERIGVDTGSLLTVMEAALGRVVAPCYSGPVGVDMMVALNHAGERFIMPCVEANLRFTMGFVAKAVADRCPDLCPALTTDSFLYINS